LFLNQCEWFFIRILCVFKHIFEVKIFHLVLQLILTLPNSRQVDSLGKADDPSSLLGIWLQWKYWECGGTGDLSSIRKARVRYISLLFTFCYNAVWWFVYDWSSAVHHCTKWAHEGTLHIKDLVLTFVTIAKIDSNFFNFIWIAWVIHLLCPGELDKADHFSFFMF